MSDENMLMAQALMGGKPMPGFLSPQDRINQGFQALQEQIPMTERQQLQEIINEQDRRSYEWPVDAPFPGRPSNYRVG